VCALDYRPLDLGVMSLDRARTLDRKPVTVSLIVAKPVYTLLGRTMVGAADRDDDVESRGRTRNWWGTEREPPRHDLPLHGIPSRLG